MSTEFDSDINKPTTLPSTSVVPEEAIAQSIIPYSLDDNKGHYLALRAGGLAVREALKLIGCGHSALSMWRTDQQFVTIENDLPKYRKQLAKDFVHMEFIRNYILILEKDHRVIHSSLNPTKTTIKIDGMDKEVTLPMEQQDHAYLLKARSHYTPQQLEVIEKLLTGDGAKDVSWEQIILAAAKNTKQRVTARELTIESE
jgi:hypothetical protein